MANGNVAGPQAQNVRPTIQYVEDFFVYDLDIAALAAGGVNNANIQMQADSDFKLVKLGMMADIAAAAQTESSRVLPLCTLQLVDSGSGRQLFSAPVALGAIFGDGRLPFILPVPRIFKARTNIQLALTNYSAATTYNLRLALIGSKIFQLGQ